MLIKGVSEKMDTAQDSELAVDDYTTANELFELMAKDHNLDDIGCENLSESEIVLLYKNLDLGTELMNSAKECHVRAPNQYVETVVYEAESESELSDNSLTDLHSALQLQAEQLNILNTSHSNSNILCPKIGGFKLPHESEQSIDYNKCFFLRNPVKQSNVIRSDASIFGQVTPPSLLDYICASRSGCDLYIDNVISYFQHIIEQLRRICNGDYLTDKAKQKWRQTVFIDHEFNRENKMLAGRNSLPLNVDCTYTKRRCDLNDIIHSEVDFRTLSKILEKRIILQLPKQIFNKCNNLFGKRCADHVFISCKKAKTNSDENDKKKIDARLNVVLKLDCIKPDEVITNVAEICIMQTSLIANQDSNLLRPLPPLEEERALVETIPNPEDNLITEVRPQSVPSEGESTTSNIENINLDANSITTDECYHSSSNEIVNLSSVASNKNTDEDFNSIPESFETNSYENEICGETRDQQTVCASELLIANESKNSMKSFHTDNEENEVVKSSSSKKKSSKIRVKSPYENQTLKMEENKRKRLLEIREKRTRKKQAYAGENKSRRQSVAKNSNSVTKLSITNKSFYNSIYGNKLQEQNMWDSKRKETDLIKLVDSDDYDSENPQDKLPYTPESDIKFINKSFFLDDMVTEVALQKRKENDTNVRSTNISQEYPANIVVIRTESEESQSKSINKPTKNSPKSNSKQVDLKGSDEVEIFDNSLQGTKITLLECRKSIDKIYSLLNKSSVDSVFNSKSSHEVYETKSGDLAVNESIILETDSGTSFKHNLSSVPSSLIFKKNAPIPEMVIVPKVVIKSKPEGESKSKTMKGRKAKIGIEKPFQASPQTLQDFNNVEKIRNRVTQRAEARARCSKKDEKIGPLVDKRSPRLTNNFNRERKSGSPKSKDIQKSHIQIEQKLTPEKFMPKRIADIMDEAREARGEAVKGPTRYSRLETLAQPRRPYNLANPEEIPRQGRRYLSERIQKVAALSPTPIVEKIPRPQKHKKNVAFETVSNISMRNTSPPARVSAEAPRRRRTPPPPPARRANPPRTGTSPKRNNSGDATENIKKSVQIKNEKSRAVRSPTDPAGTAIGGEAGGERRNPRQACAPLNFGSDLCATESLTHEGSTALGEKLHEYVNRLQTRELKKGFYNLDVFAMMKTFDNKNELTLEDEIKYLKRTDSNIQHIDIFKDKSVLTAVEDISGGSEGTPSSNVSNTAVELKRCDSRLEIKKLEDALYSQMYSGPYQKRLRIKNLTLTSRHSLQQLVLQSGDVGTLLSKTSLCKTRLSSSKSETRSNLAKLSMLSKNAHFSLRLPTQITTAGYAFPEVSPNSSPCTHVVKSDSLNNSVVKSKSSSLSKLSVSVVLSPKKTISEIIFSGKNTNDSISIVEFKSRDKKTQQSEKVAHLKTLHDNINPTLDRTESACVLNDNVDMCTSSMDMLVKLLNEIKKMTVAQITDELNPNKFENNCEEEILRNLEYSTNEIMSIASVNPILRPLESSISSFSFLNDVDLIFPIYCNKEVATDIPQTKLINGTVGVQSKLLVTKVCKSTVITNSLLDIRSPKPVMRHIDSERIISKIQIHPELSRISIIEITNEEPQILQDFSTAPPQSQSSDEDFVDSESVHKDIVEKNAKVQPCGFQSAYKEIKDTKEKTLSPVTFDDSKRIKRDILLTVYSVLVVTIFAALAVPDLLY